MMHRIGLALFLSLAVATSRGTAKAQEIAIGERGANTPTATEALLDRPTTVDLARATLTQAIDAAAASARVVVQYQVWMLDAYAIPVTLHLKQAPLREVLARILSGTTLHVVPDGTTRLTIVEARRGEAGQSIAQGSGLVTGTVRDAKTKQPLRSVAVTLDDRVNTERTNEAGQYRFTNVAAGAHRISVRAIGFARQTKPVTIAEHQEQVVNFSLESNISTLDQVVVTATGAQRYRELGHVVAQINADSLVKEAPITSVSELLTARIPGLQVTGTNGGSVGGDVALRLRGTTTTALDPQPIVVVDGVRYKNTNTIDGALDTRPFGAELRSPLNDLNVNDIETVEVVKGPSASTLYGPDAANGVIVITTKHGQAGRPVWHIYAYPDLSTMSVGSSTSRLNLPVYQGWGHVPNDTATYQGECTIYAQVAGSCVLDSVITVPDPKNDPQLSVLAKQRPQWHAGASVSGGAPGLSYFFSGNRDSQTGALRLSPIAATILENQLGVSALSNAMKTPNTQQSVSLHATISSELSTTSRVTLVGNYTNVNQRAIDVGVLGVQSEQIQFDPGYPYSHADSMSIYAQQSVASAFLSTTLMHVDRLTAALSGVTQPWRWLMLNASIGTDLDNTTDRGIRPRGESDPSDGGEADDNHRANVNRDAHFGATATAHPGRWSFRTSSGLDYAYVNLDGLNTQGSNLAPGSTDITTAAYQGVGRLWVESASLGGYGEEVVGLNDRLFLTGSLRIDGSTTFGDKYTPRPAPKLGVSYVLSDEPILSPLRDHGLTELRLRYSYGAASRYPTSAMKLGRIGVVNTQIEGTTAAIFDRQSAANPDLRPERSKEAEYGVDATIASVVQLGLTWYNRRTDDGLEVGVTPQGVLAGWVNVGDLSVHGVEATLQTKIFETNRASLNVFMSYSHTANTVVSLGDAREQKDVYGGYAVGYPLGAAFGSRTIGYADTAGGLSDSVIADPSEVISSSVQYLGPYYAPNTYTITPTLSMLGGRIRVSTLFDRQSGGVQFNPLYANAYSGYHVPALFLRSTPLLDQARNLGINQGDYVESSDFTRWREFNVTGELPTTIRRFLRLSRASASLQVRNLALWTPARAPDPESTPGLGTLGYVGLPNNFALGAPQPRTWTIRFDIAP